MDEAQYVAAPAPVLLDSLEALPPPTMSDAWPPVCTLAELGRILTLIHGVRAPAESSLKKWSAAGAFRDCTASAEEVERSEAPSSVTHQLLQKPRRAGRPGLRLRTAAALDRVHEIWPFLAGSDSQPVLDLAVARTADRFRAALDSGTTEQTNPVSTANLHQVQEQLDMLTREMAAVRREMAQFSALRNNLITRLDDVVEKARNALEVAGPAGSGGADPLVEARRDRDMGLMKSTLSEILATLQRLETAGKPGVV